MMRVIATFGGIGHLRPAPGTWGSLASLVVALPLYWIGGPWLVVILTIAAFAIGIPATRSEVAASGKEDPGQVVIDEVVGQWIALLPVLFGAASREVAVTALWPGWLAAFVLFRLFDILKPGPVGRADARGDALGVMLDDVIAGVFAAIGVAILAAIYHIVLV